MDYADARHPISYVARRTGLSTHVVRVWEKRYGAVRPQRTETKRRLYSDADIDRLKLLQRVSASGHTISRIANLSDGELKQLLRDSTAPVSSPQSEAREGATESAAHLSEIMRHCHTAIQTLNWESLDETLTRARLSMSDHVLLEDVIGPLMIWVGERWHDGSVRVAQEHLATATVKGFLARMRSKHRASAGAPAIAIATPQGHAHEIGALLVATLAGIEGWREYYFGADIPAAEFASGAIQAGARIVALSIATPGDDPGLPAELEELRQLLPEDCIVLVGGGGAHRHKHLLEELRFQYVSSLSDFRILLRTARD